MFKYGSFANHVPFQNCGFIFQKQFFCSFKGFYFRVCLKNEPDLAVKNESCPGWYSSYDDSSILMRKQCVLLIGDPPLTYCKKRYTVVYFSKFFPFSNGIDSVAPSQNQKHWNQMASKYSCNRFSKDFNAASTTVQKFVQSPRFLSLLSSMPHLAYNSVFQGGTHCPPDGGSYRVNQLIADAREEKMFRVKRSCRSKLTPT